MPASTFTSTPSPGPTVYFGYTYHQPDGNRFVSGQGNLLNIRPLDITLAGEPRWLVAAPVGNQGVWVVALEDGHLQAFRVSAGGYEELPITPAYLPAGAPPLLKVQNGMPSVVIAPGVDASPLTNPVLLPLDTDRMVYIEIDGDVVITDGIETTRLAVDALPDARLLVDEVGRLLLLTNPTNRYNHGVLGDAVEAGSITLIDTLPVPSIVLRIDIPPPAVIEGIAPIWADINADGQREIIVTLSDREEGAQIAVFNEGGERIASGPSIGRGYRWRHQLAVAPFAPNGDLELVDVLTPHIGGVVEFYQFSNNMLRITALMPGYTSHVLGTRNLDMAIAGDLDGDQRVEVLLPDQSRMELGAIRRTPSGTELAWTWPVSGTVTTNLATVSFPDGSIAVGVGRDDGILRIWAP